MTPTAQSKLFHPEGIHSGNCYAACLASLLDLPLWMVPPWEDMFGRGAWKQRTDEWLERLFQQRLVRTQGHELAILPEFYIANGLSPREVYHSVIYSAGKLVHDPHPSNAGIGDVEWTWHLEPVALAA